MLKAQRTAYVMLSLALDIATLMVAFFVVWFLRAGLGEFLVHVAALFGSNLKPLVRRVSDLSPNTYQILLSGNPLVNIQKHLWMLYLAIPSWLFFLNTQRGYDPQARRTVRQEFAVCAYAGLLGTVAVMVFTVLFKFDISRLLLVGFVTLGVSFLWLQRTLLLPLAQRRGGRAVRNMIVIGPHSAAANFAKVLETPAYSRSRLLGYVYDDTVPTDDKKIPHIGTLRELSAILDRDVVDEVVLVRSISELREKTVAWGDILEMCLERGNTVSLVDDMAPPMNAKVEAHMMGNMPTMVLHNTPQNTVALAVKDLMDRTIALMAILVLTFIIPVFPIVALLIKLGDGGPVFFTQQRVGLNGRLFPFYKFRSMHIRAQEILETMKREEPEKYRAINIMEEPFFKARDGDDPRITPIGRFIRKTSIDELPQFWNVLRGDMSLVGPRPPLPKEVADLQAWHKRKLSVKGGLTCIWQASGRNDVTDVDEWMRMDLEYIDNWSLWLDVKLLFKTLKAMVTTKGAS